MRLLSVDTLKLTTFYNRSKRPPYAILSHTWGEEEVSFEDIKNLNVARRLQGFSKVESCCRTAHERGFSWIWIDTCCIDKRSSAELSEAINSMFKWYEDAAECYAYLVDVDFRYEYQTKPFNKDEFSQSSWFTRGWTLQELIAPRSLLFYSSEWRLLSRREELSTDLAGITSISESILEQSKQFVGGTKELLSQFSIAQKMSWASSRQTTREEDIAYCLIGLFDVNMPLLYGEGGKKAFIRLQEEILKHSEDHSIFLWNRPNSPSRSLTGLLADSPRVFSSSGSYVPTSIYRHPHEMTNLGLRITLPVIIRDPENHSLGYVGIISARNSENLKYELLHGSIRIGIPLVEDPLHRLSSRRLRAVEQPLLTVHVIVHEETGHQIAGVMDSLTAVPKQLFQNTTMTTIYVRQP